MAVKRISPAEAKQKMDEGYVYLDVRSVPEFDAGHPAGAKNAPIAHMGGQGQGQGQGMSPNADFVRVVQANFPADAKLVLGCKSGGRSQKAAMMLEAAGFTNLLEMRGGFGGEADGMGRMVEKGWEAAGLPVERQAGAGASWSELKAKG